MFKRKGCEIAGELACEAPVQMPARRPFLDQIDTDLSAKIAEYNKLGADIMRLEALRSTLRRHEEFDGLVKYFLEKKG